MNALRMQSQLRNELYDPHNREFRAQEKGLKLARPLREEHIKAFPAFRSFAGQARRGSSTSWIALGLNILAFLL